MRQMLKPFLLAGASAMLFTACQRDVEDAPQPDEISPAVMAQIKALGFGTDGIQKVEEGYLVEGDIIISNDQLRNQPTSPKLVIAREEQYHTFNLVEGLPRVITVSAPSSPSGFSSAVNAAIARYNAEGLNLTFQRVSSGGDINIRIVKTNQYIASAGFPNSQGDPYGSISYSNRYINYSSGFMTTVVAHEIGHCIGFRHTDYMNRSYSCGGTGGNEGSGSVGAVHIPGTPTSPDARSWMLACLSSSTDRPFNSNDKTALNYLY